MKDNQFDEETNEVTTTASSLVNWSNPPKVADLKQDFTEAHDAHVSEVNTWLAKRNWFC